MFRAGFWAFLRNAQSTLSEAVRSALASLWAYKLRSALTLLSILIGVATITALVSVISGLDRRIREEFASLGTKVLYLQRRPWSGRGRDWRRWWNAPPITLRELAAAKRCRLAEFVVPSVRTRKTVRYRQNSADATVRGTSWEFPELRRMDMLEGRFFSFGEDRKGRPVCVLGWEIWHALFEDEPASGKWVKIGGIPFRVVGVLERQGRSLAIGTLDDEVFIPFYAFIHAFGGRRNLAVLVSAPSPDDVDELEEELRSAIRGIRGLRPGDEDNFAINSQEMLLAEYRKTTRTLWAAILAVAGLSLFVGGIGVMNIMLVAVRERTREIGVRKAVGATKLHILAQFLLEALTQCWLGGALGLLVGILVPLCASTLLPVLPFALSWEAAAVALAFTTAVGTAFGLYPALKAAAMPPAQALRYE